MQNNIPDTLLEAVRYFSSPDTCRDFFAEIRWPNGIACPRQACSSKEVWTIKSKTRGIIWRCKSCKKQFTVKVGTIFEDSPIGLEKWLPAVWMLTSSKKGVSSYQLARALGVEQKTAWFMLHRIRASMKAKSYSGPLFGEIEVDETFIGGRERFKHAGRRLHLGTGGTGKTAVMGLLQRRTEVRAKCIPNVRRNTVQAEVMGNIAPGAAVFSDALQSYNGLERHYRHEIIDHAKEFVRGRVHTNGLENFWSHFKRMIYGTHHSIEPFHIDRYLDDATFRYNTREMGDGARFALAVAQSSGRRLTYRKLTRKC